MLTSFCICCFESRFERTAFTLSKKQYDIFNMTSNSNLEVRSVIKFCQELGHTPSKTFEMMEKTGLKCSKVLVFKWHRRFREGRVSLDDDTREGRPAMRHILVDDVKAAVNGDRRLTVREITDKVRSSYGTVERILTQDLNMRKVSARWVPRLLSSSDKERRVACSKGFLRRYRREGTEFLDRIITLDETWLHHFEPESKRQSSVWKTPASPPPKKAKVVKSMKKHMFVFVMDRKGMLLIHQVPDGQTVTADYFSKVTMVNLETTLN